jgi:hypothetical protein
VLLVRLRRIAIPTAFLAAASVATDLAWADQQPVRITYQAEGACPSERSFRQDVESRTLLARQPTGRETRQFIVMLKDQGRQSLGRLLIGDQHGSVVTREVTGESCAEVASALALITALAIDPQVVRPGCARRDPLVQPRITVAWP